MTNAWVEKLRAKRADMKRRRRFAQIDTFSGPAKTYTRHWAMAIILGVPITAGVSIWILHKTPAELGNAASWASAIATTAAISFALWQAYAAKQTARLERRRQDRMILDERRAAAGPDTGTFSKVMLNGSKSSSTFGNSGTPTKLADSTSCLTTSFNVRKTSTTSIS